jgi:hypothetical protein
VSKRKLPLKSPNWWPIREALEHRCQQTVLETVAVNDFNQELKAGRLRVLVRRDDRRELLPASAWDDFYVSTLLSLRPMQSRTEVFSHSHKGKPPPGHWFYVWKPDYERIFGAVRAPSEPVAPSSAAVRAPSGPVAPSSAAVRAPSEGPPSKGKGGRPLKHDWVSLTLEASWHFRHNPKSTRNAVIRKLENWCQTHSRPSPVLSELQTLVRQVYEHVQKHDAAKTLGKRAF